MKARALFALSLTLLTALAAAEPLKFNLFVKGEKAGTMTTETTGDDTQGYLQSDTLTLKKDGKTITLESLQRYDKEGVTTSTSMTVTMDEGSAKAKAKLSDDGAKVSINAGEESDEKEVPLASKTSRADATNFWFKKTTPKVGDKVVYQRFDLQNLEWSDVSLTYKGKNKVKVGDHEIEGHEIERVEGDEKGTILLDDKGDLLAQISGDTAFERAK